MVSVGGCYRMQIKLSTRISMYSYRLQDDGKHIKQLELNKTFVFFSSGYGTIFGLYYMNLREALYNKK